MIARAGASVELVGVSKRFGDKEVLPPLSLTIAPGEFVCFLGPSGSGKTTTLNIIAGFTEPTSGDVLIDGAAITGVPPHRRDLGMVFQHYALFPHMSVQENVAFPLRRRKIPNDEIARRVADALSLVGLSDRANALPKQLSGGQQQRVALARALVYRPRVLLMDEPLGALDKKLRERLQQEIKRIHQELGVTFVFVTHDQEEALTLADRIVIFDQGRIVQVGTGAELYQSPNTRFVAEFIGEVNIFVCRLGEREGTLQLENGHTIFVSRRNSAAPQVLAVRPERMAICTSGSEVGASALTGTISSIDYFGSSRRIYIDVDGLRNPISIREALGGRHEAREVGEKVSVHWPPEASVLLDA